MEIPERSSSQPVESPASSAKSDPSGPGPKLSPEEVEEARRIRRLQIMMNMVMSVLAQEELSLEEASELAANAKRAALAMFPDKELAYDLIYRPRLQRVLRERFRLQ
jgi:hypothetical protein